VQNSLSYTCLIDAIVCSVFSFIFSSVIDICIIFWNNICIYIYINIPLYISNVHFPSIASLKCTPSETRRGIYTPAWNLCSGCCRSFTPSTNIQFVGCPNNRNHSLFLPHRITCNRFCCSLYNFSTASTDNFICQTRHDFLDLCASSMILFPVIHAQN